MAGPSFNLIYSSHVGLDFGIERVRTLSKLHLPVGAPSVLVLFKQSNVKFVNQIFTTRPWNCIGIEIYVRHVMSCLTKMSVTAYFQYLLFLR